MPLSKRVYDGLLVRRVLHWCFNGLEVRCTFFPWARVTLLIRFAKCHKAHHAESQAGKDEQDICDHADAVERDRDGQVEAKDQQQHNRHHKPENREPFGHAVVCPSEFVRVGANRDMAKGKIGKLPSIA
jgi:hypothetical protein